MLADTLGKLCIAGVTNTVHIPVLVDVLERSRLKISGKVTLKMTDFGIAPPAPNIGLGLMKCKDEVTISFEWMLEQRSDRPPNQRLVPLALNYPSPAFKRPLALNHYSFGQDIEVPTKVPQGIYVPAGVSNIALGRVPTCSDRFVATGVLQKLTDGHKEAGDVVLLRKGAQWVQLDLGRTCELFAIALWHAHDAPKVFHNVIIEASDDPEFTSDVQTLFNNDQRNELKRGTGTDLEYVETYLGKVIGVDGVKARYLRLYSRGSSDSAMNEYTEIEIYGR